MARVTDAEVEAIIEYDDSIDLTPFILVANIMVTDNCADDDDYDADLLKEIERWLSAHFYHIRDQHVASEKAGTVAVTYQYKVDLALNVTTYGQQAMLLDFNGHLAQLNKRIVDGEAATIQFEWLGQDYSTADPTD